MNELERLDEKFLDASGGNPWVCEAHPDLPWPHDDCPGPGRLRDEDDGDLR